MTTLARQLTASIVAAKRVDIIDEVLRHAIRVGSPDEVAARFGVERLSSLYAGKLPAVTREVALSLYTERAKELRAEMERGLS